VSIGLPDSRQPAAPADSFVQLLSAGEVIDAGRIVVVVAHPDDETIGLGGQLPRLSGLRILHTTDGAPENPADAERAGFSRREDYAQARRAELAAAMALAGIPAEALHCFWITDQTAVFNMPEITRRLADWFRAETIGTVLTHTHDGGHPDHEATLFCVHAACHLLAREGNAPPAIVEFPLYHQRDGRTVGLQFPRLPESVPGEVTIQLDGEAMGVKMEMLAEHGTQWWMLQNFRSAEERFRPAPRYDFSRLPNGGELLYEKHGWLTGEEWLRQVDQTCRMLDLPKCL
jgi:N-acetylglucosamine malate deacetylase 2